MTLTNSSDSVHIQILKYPADDEFMYVRKSTERFITVNRRFHLDETDGGSKVYFQVVYETSMISNMELKLT